MCYNKNNFIRKDVSSILTATVKEMFCVKCGNQIPDESKFCPVCGSQVVAEPQPEVKPAEAPVEEIVAQPEVQPVEIPAVEQVVEPVAEQVVEPVAEPVAEPVFAQPAFEQPIIKPKKKTGKLLAWLIPSATLLVAAAVAAIFFLDPIKGWWLKNFGSDKDYRDYVQDKTKESALGTVTNAYDKVLSTLTGETEASGATEMSLKLNIGDTVLQSAEDYIESMCGEPMDLAWLQGIEVKMSANMQDEMQQIGAALNIGDEEIAVIDAILSMDEGMLFVAVTNLSDEYLGIDLGAQMDDISLTVQEMMQDPELLKALPTGEELDALLSKYWDIVMENLTDVEQFKETVKVGKVEQKLTVLETTVDAKDLLKVAKAVLKEAEKDKDIEKILENIIEFANDQDLFGYEMDADDVIDSFQDTIGMALDALKETDADDLGEGEIIFTEYVNGSDEIVGYTLTMVNEDDEEEELFRYIEVTEGDEFGFEFIIPDSLEIVGSGTKKNGVINADYTITVISTQYEWEADWSDYEIVYEEMEIATITLVDFKAEENNVNGKIWITPSAEMWDNMGLTGMASSIVDIAEVKLELDIASTGTSGSLGINVLAGSELIAGVTISAEEKEASDISLPDTYYTEEDVEAWAETIDVEKLEQVLEDLGIPVFAAKQETATTPEYYF